MGQSGSRVGEHHHQSCPRQSRSSSSASSSQYIPAPANTNQYQQWFTGFEQSMSSLANGMTSLANQMVASANAFRSSCPSSYGPPPAPHPPQPQPRQHHQQQQQQASPLFQTTTTTFVHPSAGGDRNRTMTTMTTRMTIHPEQPQPPHPVRPTPAPRNSRRSQQQQQPQPPHPVRPTPAPRNSRRSQQQQQPPAAAPRQTPVMPTVLLTSLRGQEDIDKMTTKQMKELLDFHLVSTRGCIERNDLAAKVKELLDDEKLKRRLRDQNETSDPTGHDICKICMDDAVDCVFVECGHMVSCLECGKKLQNCPICRQSITRVIKTFRS